MWSKCGPNSAMGQHLTHRSKLADVAHEWPEHGQFGSKSDRNRRFLSKLGPNVPELAQIGSTSPKPWPIRPKPREYARNRPKIGRSRANQVHDDSAQNLAAKLKAFSHVYTDSPGSIRRAFVEKTRNLCSVARPTESTTAPHAARARACSVRLSISQIVDIEDKWRPRKAAEKRARGPEKVVANTTLRSEASEN